VLGPKAPTLYGALATLASHLSLGEVLQPDLLDQYNHHDPSLSYRVYATGCDDAIARSAFVLRMIGVIQPLGGFIPWGLIESAHLST
jgi:hypothetical protein